MNTPPDPPFETPPVAEAAPPRRDRSRAVWQVLGGLVLLFVIAGLVYAWKIGSVRIVEPPRNRVIAIVLAQAISEYQDEYKRLPFPVGLKEEHFQSDPAFIQSLTGKDATLNKKRINFLGGIPEAKGNPPIWGRVAIGEKISVVDSNSRCFEIYLDHDNDGKVTNPEGGPPLPVKIAVISAGEDGMLSGTNARGKDAKTDNSRSW